MLLLNQVLFTHTLDRVILVILLILAKHDLSKGAPSEHFKQLKFLKGANIINVTLILKDKLTLGLHLLVLLNRF
jgi:hypothetical protein